MTGTNKISLQDIRVAVLVSDGFEEPELNEPMHDLVAAGAQVEILALHRSQMQRGIQGMHGMRLTHLIQPKALIQDVSPTRYQGLLIPGGALSVDGLRESRIPIGFLQNMLSDGKPVGMIGHAAWLLADSGMARGKSLTSWSAIQKDLERAGAIWKDREVIVDGNLITSRGAADLPRFGQIFMEQLAQVFQVSFRAA